VVKLNAAGSALAYSTFLGGSGIDSGNGIALDSSGNAYVTGETRSTDFPTTEGAFQPNFAGGQIDAFVTALDSAGSTLAYSTYLGGKLSDVGLNITLDVSGNVYVTGETRSTDFPTTEGAYQTIHSGNLNDVFVSKLNIVAAIGNNPPSIPELVYPENGETGLETTITFRWKEATDPNGDTITYDFYYCDDENFTGCSPVEVTSLLNAAISYAGIGDYTTGLLLFGAGLIIYGLKGKRGIALPAVMIIAGMYLVSCGGGGGSSTTTSKEIDHEVSGLSAGTTYYWKVVANDDIGAGVESETWSFTTQ
jgi:hypothetical protein